MTLFSIRAFAAFFGSIALASLTLVAARNGIPYRELARTGMYLIVPITVAALLHFDRFDLLGVPGTFLYLGAYLLVGVLIVWFLAWSTRHPEPFLPASAGP
jgi:hypothetical protein